MTSLPGSQFWGPLFKAALVNYVWPNSLLWSISLCVVMLPNDCGRIVGSIPATIATGFVDKLHLGGTPELQQAFVSLGLYITAFLLRRLISLALSAAHFVFDHCWVFYNLAVLAGTSAAILKKVLPPTWKSRLHSAWVWFGYWLISGPVNLIYFTVIALTSFQRHAVTTIAHIVKTAGLYILSAQTTFARVPAPKTFNYSLVPNFDPASEIRLLRLHRWLPFLQLSAELVSYPLHAVPPYYAISYVWDDGPKDLDQIWLNGMLFSVRRNVHDILRNCSSGFGPRLIWVDSICINQQDLSEKALKFEPWKIYIRELATSSAGGRLGEKGDLFLWRHPVTLDELHGWREVICDGQVLSSLATLAADPDENLESTMSPYLGFTGMTFTVAHRMERSIFGPPQLSRVLRVFGDKAATVDRDKAFALFGMAKESTDPNLKRMIDYVRPAQDIMLDLANYLLDCGQALEVFDLAGLQQRGRDASLPSWAVDWSALRSGMPLNTAFNPHNLQYHAAAELSPKVRRGASRRKVVMSGQHLDRITHIVPLPEQSTRRAASFEYPGEVLSFAKAHASDPYPYRGDGGQPLAEAVWRTLIGDKTHSARPAPPTCGRDLAVILSTTQNVVAVTGSRFGHFTPHQLQSMLGVTEHEQAEIRQALARFQEVELLYDSSKGSSPLVFCVTAKGYIGMVPQVSQVGDDDLTTRLGSFLTTAASKVLGG
ncbi:unnamed protein product [Parascedosporium putredinis]|uniref:Heterokaryon incompatibility domain-containing protein n=1 Tax=Parascedosporium putredinis TaxID=1442378 RepID=A0A9P1MF12_9PEZI|nr:unnamed protein product [Parascedosporium putredinis]CAI8004015.1 unnamed protein product [Parascedosporium putredinis]